jgi:hypothetical protein
MNEWMKELLRKNDPGNIILAYGLTDSNLDTLPELQLPDDITILADIDMIDIIAKGSFLTIIDDEYLNNNPEDYDLFHYYAKEIRTPWEYLLIICRERSIPDYNGIGKISFMTRESFNDKERLQSFIIRARNDFLKRRRLDRVKGKRLKNILTVYDYLKENKEAKASVLAEKLKVSTRTIHRYMHDLCLANDLVVYDKNKKCWCDQETRSLSL